MTLSRIMDFLPFLLMNENNQTILNNFLPSPPFSCSLWKAFCFHWLTADHTCAVSINYVHANFRNEQSPPN